MENNMKVMVIIQARMGSTRLPGKVMKIILGKPVLIHDLERIKGMKRINGIIVATTTLEEDNLIVKTIEDYDANICIYRGNVENVLDRYYKAAKLYGADVIVRITSDCPLIDTNISDITVDKFFDGVCDYCSNNLPRTFPLGLDTEVFSFKSLELAWELAETSFEREHVTPYIRDHPEKFKLASVTNNIDLSHLRWTLDYPEDFEFINEIYKRLGQKFFNTNDILKVLKNEPFLMEINRKYTQNKKMKFIS
jgi:spore coat polysaccharide biosynthesis protein SpsF (cytidylyltransferase family)